MVLRADGEKMVRKQCKTFPISPKGYEPSKVKQFRDKWLKKGYELINITSLCELKMGISGSCNDINEPAEEIYHIQVHYRNEVIANIVDGIEIINEDTHTYFLSEKWKGDNISSFIIFRKVKE